MTGQELKMKRLEMGIRTHAAAAEICGVTRAAWSFWEAGKRPVPRPIIKLLECIKVANKTGKEG